MVATPVTPSSAELERIHTIITTARRTQAPASAQGVHPDTSAAKRLSFASDGSPLVVVPTARPAARTRAILIDSDTDEQPDQPDQQALASARQCAPESSDGAASSSADYHSATSGDDDVASMDDLGRDAFNLEALTLQV